MSEQNEPTTEDAVADAVEQEAARKAAEDQGISLSDLNKPPPEPAPGYKVVKAAVPTAGVPYRLEDDHYLWGRFFQAGSVVMWDEKRDGKPSRMMTPLTGKAAEKAKPALVDRSKAPARGASRSVL